MTEADDKLLRERATGLRILALALISGALTTSGVFLIAVFWALDGKPLLGAMPAGVPLVSLIGLGVALPSLALSFVAPARMRRTAAERWASGVDLPGSPGESAVSRLAAAYTGSLIVGMALAEAPAMMGAIFFLLEGHWLSLLPVGLGILAMIWMFPSAGAMRDWVEDRLAELPDRPNFPAAR